MKASHLLGGTALALVMCSGLALAQMQQKGEEKTSAGAGGASRSQSEKGAQQSEPKGGYRELGPGGFATSGINDVYHPNSAAACKKAYPKSYDPATMTFVGKDGARHPCP